MVIKDKEEYFLSYLEDTSNVRGSASILYIPESILELQAIIRDCFIKKIPLTCSAARTGTTAGCVPFEGAILSLEKINKIINIDPEHGVATVEAGLSLADLEKALNKLGLTLKAKPTEPLALVGGIVSTGASGTRSFRYGSIRNYIKRLEVFLSDGTLLNITRGKFFAKQRKFSFSLSKKNYLFPLPAYTMPYVKNQAGYFIKDNMDLIDLFIGSEGTLGVIAKVEISVQFLAEETFDGVVFFNKESDGFNFIERIRKILNPDNLYPTSLEFFDANSLNFIKYNYSHIPLFGCAVYFEQEAGHKNKDKLINIWADAIKYCSGSLDNIWFGDTPLARNKIYEFRHMLPQTINEFLRKYHQTKLSTDIAVPPDNFKEMYYFYKSIADGINVDYVNFGHIGENHLHFNFLPRTDSSHHKAQNILRKFAMKTVSLGGTISAEHGIGKIKRQYLEIMYGEKSIREMALLKKYFDPYFILGRDNIFRKDILEKGKI